MATIFQRLRRERRGALMPFVTGGFPDLATTSAVLPAIAAAGGDIIEVGIPFSDPIADGPVIAQSMTEALARGATPRGVLEAVAATRNDHDAGVLAMVSVSIVERLGAAPFAHACVAAGVDGLIVPDIDLDDAPALRRACDDAGITCTLLVAPTSSPARIARIVGLCSGFVYLLARAGVTGERGALPEGLADRVGLVRAETDLPVAVGFGISTPEQVASVVEVADAAIVGSAIVRRMTGTADPVSAAVECVRGLRSGIAARAGA